MRFVEYLEHKNLLVVIIMLAVLINVSNSVITSFLIEFLSSLAGSKLPWLASKSLSQIKIIRIFDAALIKQSGVCYCNIEG